MVNPGVIDVCQKKFVAKYTASMIKSRYTSVAWYSACQQSFNVYSTCFNPFFNEKSGDQVATDDKEDGNTKT